MPTPRNLTASDLVFSPIEANSKTQKATLTFKNKYGCNVYFRSPNTNRELPYEFELLYEGKQTFNDRISDGNVGYCSLSDISELIRIAQKLCER